MTRKNVEKNPLELLIALRVKNCAELVSECPEWLECEDFETYRQNLSEYNRNKLNTYKEHFDSQKPESWSDCVKVHLVGKKKFNHPLIVNADRKTGKADIYLEMVDGTFIGVSVKETAAATKSNYSVEKMLGGEVGKRCKTIRKQFLRDSGFPAHNRETRDQVNALFYDRTNVYWTEIRNAIAGSNQSIKDELVKYLRSTDNPFETWEFDGSALECLSATSTSSVTFEEFEPFYLTDSGVQRKAAKLFYKLAIVHESMCRKEYRVEIRWKGNIHSASPQFQIHNI